MKLYEKKRSLEPSTSAESPCMNQAQAAAFLGVSLKTLRDGVRRGEIPCAKIGARYVFLKDALKDTLAGKD